MKLFTPMTKEPDRSAKIRRLRGEHMLLILVAVINVILLNLVVRSLPVRCTEFDISESELYSLSSETKTILQRLDDNITVYYLGQTGSENRTLVNLLNRYADECSHFTWKQIDPVLNPMFAAQYGAADAPVNSAIVVSDQRSKVIAAEDFYEVDYTRYFTDGTYKLNWNAENQLTSALLFVTMEKTPQAYTLSDHGEAELSTALLDGFTAQNISMETLSLLSVSEIPENADAVLINAPAVDYSPEDISVLRAYLAGGGNLIAYTSPSVDTPNLLSLFAEYGLTPTEGLVMESDDNMHLRNYPYSLLPKIRYADAMSGLYGSTTNVLLPMCTGIEMDEAGNSNMTYQALLSTSESAFSKVAGFHLSTLQKEPGDLDGPFDVGVSVAFPADGGKTGHIIWLNSALFLDDASNQSVSNGNQVFTISCLSWMTTEITEVTAAKSLQNDGLTFTAQQISIYGNLATAVVPVLILAFGILVTVKRRMKK